MTRRLPHDHAALALGMAKKVRPYRELCRKFNHGRTEQDDEPAAYSVVRGRARPPKRYVASAFIRG